MNIYGAIIFVILAGGSGLFAILALTNDVTAITTDGTVLEGTTWDEYEGTREECAEMGYYYDEYGDEYEECKRYETITYYKCSSGVDFSYTLADDPNGKLIGKEETISWMESSSSCLNDIKSVYAVNQTVTVHYLSSNPEDGSLTQQFPPGVGYFCCSLCFGLLAIPALVLMLTKRGQSVGVKTGGMLGGMRPQRIPITTPTDSNTMGAQPMYDYPNPQSTAQNNQNAGMRVGGMGAGGMMMMASGAAGEAAYNPGMQPQNVSRKRYSPSKTRGYDRIINQLRLKDQTLSTQGEAIHRIVGSNMMDAKTATQFVTSPYVLKALGLAGAAGAGAAIGAGVNQASQTSESRLDTMKKEAAAFFDSAKPKVNTTPSRPVAKGESDQCQHPSCSTSVSAFDFRCFDCRRRFCSAHKGMTFQCSDCAD